jgi:hypothetical protein
MSTYHNTCSRNTSRLTLSSPAKVIRYRFPKDIIDELEAIQFWEMDMSEISTFDIHTRDIKELIRQVKEYKATRHHQIDS